MIGPHKGRLATPRIEAQVEDSRLRQLYEISRLLTQFGVIDVVFADVINVMTNMFSLRSAILRLRMGSTPPHRTVWYSAAADIEDLRAAERIAMSSWSYLDGDRHGVAPAPISDARTATTSAFITLPLVVADGGVFGVVLLDCMAPLTEADLMFLDLVVNQLAIALDREAQIQAAHADGARRRAHAEQRRELAELLQARYAFLSELGIAVASSLSSQATLVTVTRLMVPEVADGCFIDLVADDGEIERLAPVFADASKQALAGPLQRFVPRPGCASAQAAALSSGVASLVAQVTPAILDELALDPAHRAVLEQVGVASMMVIPLAARGRTFGALTLLRAESRPRFDASDVGFAEEVGRRCALGIDNAHLYELAQRAIRDRQEVLAVVSHDLRNPLSAIMMATEMLQSAPSLDPKVMLSRLGLIHRNGQRMSRMLGDLLDLESLVAGRLSIHQRRTPVAELVADAVELQQPLATAKRVQLASGGEASAEFARCDRDRILQVLVNLIGNALRFTASGGTIEVRAEPLETMVRFRVTDSGCGIPTHQLASVFDRFWQALPASASGHDGAGLGLAIARGIVEAHGGTIGVVSEVGVGSSFWFTVPLLHPAAT